MTEIAVTITVQHGSTRIEHVLKSGKQDPHAIAEEVERAAAECGSEAASICARAFGRVTA